MLIAGLIVAILFVVGIIFLLVRSVVIKLISMALVVFAFVLVLALGSDYLQQKIKPITIEDNTITIYQEGEPVSFTANKLRRIDVNDNAEGGVIVTFIVEGFAYEVPLGSISYQWSVKNVLHNKFNRILYDTTF